MPCDGRQMPHWHLLCMRGNMPHMTHILTAQLSKPALLFSGFTGTAPGLACTKQKQVSERRLPCIVYMLLPSSRLADRARGSSHACAAANFASTVLPWLSRVAPAPISLDLMCQVRIEAKPLANALGLKSRFLAPTELGGEEQEVTVEQLALLHYGSPLGGGWTGSNLCSSSCMPPALT